MCNVSLLPCSGLGSLFSLGFCRRVHLENRSAERWTPEAAEAAEAERKVEGKVEGKGRANAANATPEATTGVADEEPWRARGSPSSPGRRQPNERWNRHGLDGSCEWMRVDAARAAAGAGSPIFHSPRRHRPPKFWG